VLFLTILGRQSSTSSQSLVFDRHSSATDESPVIVPRVDGSLLRRAARTRIRRTSLSGSQPGEAGRRFGNRRSQSIHAKPSDYPERFGDVPPEGVTLQDRPVSISEIIDFGGPEYEPAESQQGIITRVHDAETEVFSRIAAEENQQQEVKAATPDATEIAVSPHIQDENVVVDTAKVIVPTAGHVNIPTTTQVPEEQVDVITPTPTVEHKTQPDNQVVLTTKPKATLAKSDSKSSKSSSSTLKPEKRSSWSFKFMSDDKSKKKKHQQQQHLTSDSLQRVSSTSSTISTASNVSSTGSSKLKHKDTNEIFSNPAKKLGLSNLFQRSNSKAQKTNINGSSVMVKKSAKSNELKVANDDFSRFPVHIERAIYRLSHYKLSNPRRPLHHQVLISNLMFWYLSIINGQKIRQQASPHQSDNTAPPESPPPSSFIIQSQNSYREEQEATPAKLGKVGRFISASKKRRQEIIEKKQIQQQHHHQPRWLPPISEGSAPAVGHVEENEKTGTHVTFAAPKTAPPANEVDERFFQANSQPDSSHGSQLTTSKRSCDDRYSPIPNQHYQPSHPTTVTHEATTSESPQVNPHPLPPIPGPPILSEVSIFDSFTDDILNSLGLEGQHATEDDDVPLALYRNRS
jgi:Activator of mitotic machinery Cdc14 phosphatase activation C-term